MIRKLPLPLIVLWLFAACTLPNSPNESYACPVTTPEQQTAKLPTTTNYENRFWYGTPELWTSLPNDGIWWGLPKDKDGYVQKTVFWREGYVAREELTPALTVSGRRMDAPAQTFSFSDATHGWDESGDFMLMGISIPAEGCWEITATYQDVSLTYVVEVVEER
ncbi:MAG: hypothetical protein Kow002_02840 [Anaerolineales bacterium]